MVKTWKSYSLMGFLVLGAAVPASADEGFLSWLFGGGGNNSTGQQSYPKISNDRYTWASEFSTDKRIEVVKTKAGHKAPAQSYAPRTAEQCTDISVTLVGVREEPRNQGQTGFCFAFTAADLISQKVGATISAVDLAAAYYRVQPNHEVDVSTLYGGHYEVAIKADSPDGYCLEDALPSDSYDKDLLKDPKFLATVPAYYRERGQAKLFVPDELKGLDGMIKIMEATQDAYEAGDIATVRKNLQNANKLLPNLTLDQIKEIADANRGKPSADLAGALIKKECEMRRVSPSRALKAYDTFTSDPKLGYLLFADIDKGLDNGQMVAITYDSNLILKQEELASHGFSAEATKPAWHASSIVGRRFDKATGRCQYRIRNSWGTDCSIYGEEIQKNCVNGYFWVSEDRLQDAMNEAYWLE